MDRTAFTYDEIFQEGYEAYSSGVGWDSNPYFEEYENSAWSDGWESAEAEYESLVRI